MQATPRVKQVSRFDADLQSAREHHSMCKSFAWSLMQAQICQTANLPEEVDIRLLYSLNERYVTARCKARANEVSGTKAVHVARVTSFVHDPSTLTY